MSPLESAFNIGLTVLGAYLGFFLSARAQQRAEREEKRAHAQRYKAMMKRELQNHIELLEIAHDNLQHHTGRADLIVDLVTGSTLAYQTAISAGFIEEFEVAQADALYEAYYSIGQASALFRYQQGNPAQQMQMITDLIGTCVAAIKSLTAAGEPEAKVA